MTHCMHLLVIICVLAMTVGLSGSSTVSGASQETIPFPEVPRISKEEVKELLGKSGAILLDCRPDEQWRASEQKLPGAVHENPLETKTWASKYPKDAKIIVY